MISLKNILVPVDFSEPSRKAVTYGLTLAARFNSRLIIAHVVPESSALMYTFPTQTPQVEQEQHRKAAQEIETLVPARFSTGLDLQTIVKTGNIEEELLRIVKDQAVDLVVMGTHGRRPPVRWFIGSVTEHILRKVPVPVLTVSHAEAEPHEIGIVSLIRILYATDLSESSNHGLKFAIELARESGAGLTVIHVIDDEDRMLWGPAMMAYLDRTKLVREKRNKLNDLIGQEKTAGLEIETIVVEGKPHRKILEIAEERGVDIIVLNLQSKTALERALLGATAERVVRLARTPVLSVPAGPAAARM